MDENTDNSTKMQVVTSLRYINISGAPLEHLLAVLQASCIINTGEVLSNKLLETLEQLGLNTQQEVFLFSRHNNISLLGLLIILINLIIEY